MPRNRVAQHNPSSWRTIAVCLVLGASIAACASDPVAEEESEASAESTPAAPPPVAETAPAAETPKPSPAQAPKPAGAQASKPAAAETALNAPVPAQSTTTTPQLRYYLGYTGSRWARDYGVVSGRCDTAAAGAARAAREVADFSPGQNWPAEVSIDDGDRACIGQALELARKGATLRWSGGASGGSWRLTVGQDVAEGGLPCREFIATSTSDSGKVSLVKGLSCRQEQATWDFRGRS